MAAAKKKEARFKRCSARGSCEGLKLVVSKLKVSSRPYAPRGGIDMGFALSRGKLWRDLPVIRQQGCKELFALNYCPFCGAKLK
jgi:hypothetical protein